MIELHSSGLAKTNMHTCTDVILIVDDNATNLKLLRVLLEAEGYAIRTASHANDALQVLRTLRPALILMDIQLPGMDGLTFTRQLKADPDTAAIPVVALTAYAMKGDEEKAREAGCVGYITKPINTRQLAAQVATFLDDARAGEQGAPYHD